MLNGKKYYSLATLLRHDSPINVVLDEIIPRKKGRGRPRTNFMS